MVSFKAKANKTEGLMLSQQLFIEQRNRFSFFWNTRHNSTLQWNKGEVGCSISTVWWRGRNTAGPQELELGKVL